MALWEENIHIFGKTSIFSGENVYKSKTSGICLNYSETKKGGKIN